MDIIPLTILRGSPVTPCQTPRSRVHWLIFTKETRMNDNKHVQAIPQDVLSQAQTKINEVAALFAPVYCSPHPAASVKAARLGRRPNLRPSPEGSNPLLESRIWVKKTQF
jgi:hypothetical protein